ncbi:MAG: holo-ACP synthase [Candidatus Nanopelagicales bacterium]
MIVGVGVDIVDVERFKWMVRRTPSTLERTMTRQETHDDSGRARSAESLAARFAAKEAVIKCLGDVAELRPLDCELMTAESGRPSIRLSGRLAELSDAAGITDWHVSLSHDGGNAIAYVIAERRD